MLGNPLQELLHSSTTTVAGELMPDELPLRDHQVKKGWLLDRHFGRRRLGTAMLIIAVSVACASAGTLTPPIVRRRLA